MPTKKIIINNVDKMTKLERHEALSAAIAYNDWLNDSRTHKDKPVIYEKFQIHESATGTLIVNLKKG